MGFPDGPSAGAPVGLAKPGVGVLRAASYASFYQDNPGALGSGTYAQSFPVPKGFSSAQELTWLACRVDFPFGPGEQALIRVYRYRKPNPGGAFSYTQITDAVTFDSSYDWSWTYPFLGAIRDFDLNPDTDSLAISNVYTAGGAPSARALRVDIALGDR